MKLIIEEEKTEVPVLLYLKEHSSYITLCAKKGTNEDKMLLQFYEDGRVKRRSLANIGDFKFDSDGKLIIE